MSVSGSAYGQGQREVWFGSAEWAEAAARDFQRRGYRRRTRGLVPGDVLVAETAEGFSVFWIPQEAAGSPSPARGECVWERGPGGEGPGEAGSSLLVLETALAKLGALLGS